MDIKELKKGLYEGVADGPRDPITNKRNQIRRRGKSKKEVRAKIEAAIQKLELHGVDEKRIKHLTFEMVALEWLKIYEMGPVKANSVRNRQKSIRVLLRYIANVNIAKVTHGMYQKILRNMFDQGYSDSYIEAAHVTAGMIFKYAIKEKMRVDNPCTGAVVPKKKLTVEDIESTNIEDEYLEPHELEEFLEATVKHGLEFDEEWFFLLAFSGMRSGEMFALKNPDARSETKIISVTKTIYNPDNNMKKYILTPPKTKAAIRAFDIDELVMQKIDAHKRKMAKRKLQSRHLYTDYHDADFLFCRENGYPFIPKTLINRMNRLLKFTSIQKKATPHIFRHTHISMLTEAGVDLNTIMNRVGHDDRETTLKVYTHVTEKMKKNASEKVSSHFRNILQMSK